MLFLCFCARSPNSLAHKLPALLELSLSVLLSLGFVGFVFVVLLCFCVYTAVQMCLIRSQKAASCTVVVNSFLYLACFCCGYSGKGRCMERHPVWLFLFGPGPVFLLVCFLGDETQVWLGDLRVVLFFVVALFG